MALWGFEAAFTHDGAPESDYLKCQASIWKGGQCPPFVIGSQCDELVHAVESFLEATSVRLFSLCQGLEPVSDFVEAFVAGGFRHARVHVGVLVGFAGDGGFQVIGGVANRLTGCRIANFLEELEVAVRVASFAFGGGAETRKPRRCSLRRLPFGRSTE